MRHAWIFLAAIDCAGCNDEASQAEAQARWKLTYICKGVYHDVTQIATCDNIVQTHYDLEQRYRPGEPDKVADKVLADLFPDDRENERRKSLTLSDPNYSGPAPSEMYVINRR